LLCCCSSCCCWGVINQNTAIFANFVQFHHAFVIAQNIALLSYFTMHSAALLGSLARLFDQFRPDLMRALAPQSPHCTTVAGHQTACARCCPDRFKLIFSPISPCFHYLHARAAVQETGSNLFSCSYVDLFRSLLQVFYANAGKD
jgi:hypothetical protein